MNTYRRALAVLAVLLLVSGCAIERGEEEEVGSAQSETITSNTITSNTITSNTITSNTITSNTITSNSLTSSSLGTPVLDALDDVTQLGSGTVGAANRTVFHYIVTCALTPAQSVTYTWSDGGSTYTVTETGVLGLAPYWATGSLDERGQHLVSGCIASRVNYFGVTVQISARGLAASLQEDTTEAELAEFPYVEGAFWGNLFSPTAALYSCYDPANVANSRAQQRDCAAGYLDADGDILPCAAVTRTGSCDDQCASFDREGQFYVNCWGSSTAITIGLQ
jgi:hypothetical protein